MSQAGHEHVRWSRPWDKLDLRVMVPVTLLTIFVTRLLWMFARSQDKWKSTTPKKAVNLAGGQMRFEALEDDEDLVPNSRKSQNSAKKSTFKKLEEIEDSEDSQGDEEGKDTKVDSRAKTLNSKSKSLVPRKEIKDREKEDEYIDPLAEEGEAKFEKYEGPILNGAESELRARGFLETMQSRRTVRQISSRSVPREVIENIIRVAHSAPSGANTQPWTFVVVESEGVKKRLRDLIEEEERINYERRMGDEWVSDLKKLGTTWEKPYLTEAPFVIVLLKQVHGVNSEGRKVRHYYPELSCGIAAGFLVAAIHNAGLVTVTSTPLNSGGKIRDLLGRPSHERVELVLPLGFASVGAEVPRISKKPLDQVLYFA